MKRWLASWSVSEDEPSLLNVVVSGVLFVLLIAAMYMAVLMVGASVDAL